MIAPVGVTTIVLSSTEAWMQKTLACHVTIAGQSAEPSSITVTTSALFALRIVMTIGLTLPPIELWTAVWAIHWVPARLSARTITKVPKSMSARQIVQLAGMTLILLPSEPETAGVIQNKNARIFATTCPMPIATNAGKTVMLATGINNVRVATSESYRMHSDMYSAKSVWLNE